MSTRRLNPVTAETKSPSIGPIPVGQPDVAKLLQQYGCGPIQFSGTDNALYERHLIFDNVVDVAAADARMHFEAVAHGVKLNQPDWTDHSHSLALSAEIRQEGLHVYLILNAYWQSLSFELPLVENSTEKQWRRWIDTSLDCPDDIVEWTAAPVLPTRMYSAGPRSVVVLFIWNRKVA